MARSKTIDIGAVLTRLLPRERLKELAAGVQLVRRRRKLDVVAFFWTLVLGFGTGQQRTLTQLRRSYELSSGMELVPSSFYDHFTSALVRLLKAALQSVLMQVAEPVRALGGLLARFQDVVTTDATVIRLHDLLKDTFPACRTNHTQAALKLHVVMSVLGAGARSVRVTSERVHEGPVFQVGKWVKGRLLLFDLAYFRYQLFSCIDRNEGFFIVRLKKSANPLVVEAHRRWRGRSVELVGERIHDVLDRLERQAIDVEVEVRFKRRSYGGVQRRGTQRFRLVAVRDEQSGGYHAYLTNIPPEHLSPEQIAISYAARWSIELFFRELKLRYRADQIPSRKPVVVEALLYAVMLTVVVSRTLLETLRKKLGSPGRRVPTERWATLFASAAADLLRILLRPPMQTVWLRRSLSRFLLHEAVDPNVSRLLLLERVESGTQYEHRRAVAQRHP